MTGEEKRLASLGGTTGSDLLNPDIA